MRKLQIETWALDIIRRVETGQPHEDFRVELKRTWIPPKKAARRIAGHANAARGEPILWLIGVDECKGVIGANYKDLSDWYQQVKVQFDGVHPTLTDLNIPYNDKTVVALMFETDRAPFVVKNPSFGTRSHTIGLELPWREGTSTRTATRSELLMLLSPLQTLPLFDIWEGRLAVKKVADPADHFDWNLTLKLYVVPQNSSRVIIPFYRCTGTFRIRKSTDRVRFHSIRFSCKQDEAMLKQTRSQLIAEGPGAVSLTAVGKTHMLCEELQEIAKISLKIYITESNLPVEIRTRLVRSEPARHELAAWGIHHDAHMPRESVDDAWVMGDGF